MSVKVQCPSCGMSYNVRDESLGARARCKKCNTDFTISVSLDDTGSSLVSGRQKREPVADRSHQPKSADGTSKDRAGSKRSSAKEPAKQPKKLGSYVIEKWLGAGGMGVVYLARDPVLDREVAIKVLPASLSRDEQRLKRFLREAKLAAKLNHTHAATVYQAGSDGKLAYIAMEFVAGSSLDRTVAKGNPMNWREATHVIRDAARGLGAAHKIGLIHRDIKPGNLMRTPDGVTKVVDFGLARAQEGDTQLTQEGALLGTPSYMAPEQWTGGEVDGRTDLYSLICTYYYLVTGHLPFEAEALPALAVQHQCTEFPDPRKYIPDLPDGICRIMARGAAKDPLERFQTAEELVTQLDVLLACPEDLLDYGSSWANPGGLERDDRSFDASTASPHVPLPEAHVPVPSGRPEARRSNVAILRFALACIVGTLVAMGFVARFMQARQTGAAATKYGTVQITLQNFDDTVELTLNGDRISIKGLNAPLELRVGQHELIASSPNFETVTTSFRVKHDETTVVEVMFVPKVILGRASEPAATVAVPQGDVATGSAIRSRSLMNLKRIALAFHMYHDTFRTFPAAVQTGPKGVPHSWRISLLPFLDKRNLFESYRRDEPWDSEHNKTLLAMMPEVYQFPGDKSDSTFASYFAIVGPGSLFQGGECPRLRNIIDGPADTLLVVESKREVPWIRPDPIPFDPEGEVPELDGWYTFDFAVALCDGSAKFLAKDIDHETLKSLVMCADRNPIDLRGGGRARKPRSESRPTQPTGSSPARPPITKNSGSIKEEAGSFALSEAYTIDRSVTMFTKTDPRINIEKHGVPMSKEQRDLVAAVDGRYLGQNERYGYQIYCFPNRGPMQLSWTGYADGNGQVSVCVWDSVNWRPSIEAYRRLLKVFEPTTYTEAVSRPPEEDRIFVFVNCTSGRVFTDAIFGR